MKKILILLIFSLSLISLVSAETDVFPVYELLVESIFGSVFLSIVGIGVILIIILLICRASSTFLIYWMAFYFMVMGTMYLGGLAMTVTFFIGFGLFAYNLIKLWGD